MSSLGKDSDRNSVSSLSIGDSTESEARATFRVCTFGRRREAHGRDVVSFLLTIRYITQMAFDSTDTLYAIVEGPSDL